MSLLLADIDATCSSLGKFDGNIYIISDDCISSLKHLVWILRRDNLDVHEYRRYLGHKKVLQTDLLPILYHYTDNVELSDVLLRLLVNLMSPPMLFFREDLPKDGAGRRIYLDLLEIAHSYKEAFSKSSESWKSLGKRITNILAIDVGLRSEEQNLVFERVLVLIRNVLQVPSNTQEERRVDNDLNVHDSVIWMLHDSGMFDFLLYILSSEYETQFHLHALEVVFLIFREQKVETLASVSVNRSEEEKQADEAALMSARRDEKSRSQQRLPPARHSRFGGTYVYQNMKSVSDRDLICHQALDRVVQRDFSRDKKKVKANFRLAKDDDEYKRQSAFFIRLCLREFCIEMLNSAFNNLVRQVKRVLERNAGFGESAGGGHDQSYLLWAMRFFLEFNRLSGFKLHLVTEALSTGSIHWIQNQIQHDMEMIQTDKKKKIKWNRRLQLGIQAYREFLRSLQAMEQSAENDDDAKALLTKLKTNAFYVVEYREMILQLLLSYNENSFTRNYLRDLIETTNVFLKMMEKYCRGSVMVQTTVRKKTGGGKKKKVQQKKKEAMASKENVMEKMSNDWDMRISANLSVVLANDVNNISEVESSLPTAVAEEDEELPIDEQRINCRKRIQKLLQEEDYERAVLLMRAARARWSDGGAEIFGTAESNPEDELVLMKEIFLTDIESTDGDENGGDNFWNELENSASSDNEDDEEERETAMKEVVLHFADFEKRLLNPKVVRACTWCLHGWEKMSYEQIKSAVTLLHRIAVNLKSPVLLMQAQLFRVFQQVFNVPKDNRYDELRRLGAFVVRQFVKIAPQNPKIYAELLFYSTMRESYEIEHGYTEGCGGVQAKTKAWTEEQEEELRRLFMLNQESPQTDQDVIDWLCESLTEAARTRRDVIKKLKEIGLIFKAPTKKSNAAALNKNLFIREEDEKLRELFDEHRLEADCLKRIMEVFDKKRSKKAVAKRMVQLGLIADESEILPSKKQKKSNRFEHERQQQRERSENETSSASDSDESEEDEMNPGKRRQEVSRRLEASFQIKQKEAMSLRHELEETFREGIDWIIESLNEAAEDFEEVSEELDDAIPIVPLADSQKEALENPQFQRLLTSLNLIEPSGNDNYWKIPANMIPEELQRRAKILSGESAVEVEDDNIINNNRSDDDEDDDADDLFSRLRAQREHLIYNQSDNEDAGKLESLQKKKKPAKKIGKPNEKLIKSLKVAVDGEALKWLVTSLNDRMMTNDDDDDDDEDKLSFAAELDTQRDALRDSNFKKLLTALQLEHSAEAWRIPALMSSEEMKLRAELLQLSDIEVDDENNEWSSDEEQMIIKRKKKKQPQVDPESEDFGINTQALKQRLADLSASSDDEKNETSGGALMENQSRTKASNKRKIMDSSDEEEDIDSQRRRKSIRRDGSSSPPDENEMNAPNNTQKPQRQRRIIDSDDDE